MNIEDIRKRTDEAVIRIKAEEAARRDRESWIAVCMLTTEIEDSIQRGTYGACLKNSVLAAVPSKILQGFKITPVNTHFSQVSWEPE